MLFSTAKTSITPDWPVLLAGYLNRPDKSEEILEDIFVKALYLNDGMSRVLFIILDLCMLDGEFVSMVKRELGEIYGLSEKEIFIHTTHTHTGPLTYMPKQIDSMVFDASKEYMDFLYGRIIECTKTCMKNPEEGIFKFGMGQTFIGANRRVETEEGISFGVDFEYEVDRTLSVGAIYNIRGEVKAIIYSCACHPVSLGGTMYISPDFPGVASRIIEGTYPGATALFIQGACGDINNAVIARTNEMISEEQHGRNSALVIGRILANDVINIYSGRMKEENVILNTRLDTIKLPLGKDRIDDIENLLKDPRENVRAYAEVMLKKEKEKTLSRECYIKTGTININEKIVIAFLEGEVCNDIADAIKGSYKNEEIIVAGYANGYIGYLPSSSMIAVGGYEVDSLWSRFGYPGAFSEDMEAVVTDYFKAVFQEQEV